MRNGRRIRCTGSKDDNDLHHNAPAPYEARGRDIPSTLPTLTTAHRTRVTHLDHASGSIDPADRILARLATGRSTRTTSAARSARRDRGRGVVTIPVVLCPFDDSVQALDITAGPGRCHEAQLSGIAAVTPIFVSRETCDQLSDDGPAGRSLSRPVIAATQVSRRRRDVGGHIGRPIDGHKRVHVWS